MKMRAQTIIGRDPETGRPLSLRVEAGAIARIDCCDEDTDLYLSAGFVDLQVNGCAGFDVNGPDLSTESVTGLVQAMLDRGVTSFAPTVITAPEDSICRALRVIAQARRYDAKVAACIPFVHVEGPHISPVDGYRGAHAVENVRPPSMAEFNRWQEAAAGLVGLVTLSPHYDECPGYIAELFRRGVHVAIGHTHASAEQVQRAVDAGARLSTHLGNGIATQIARHENPLWAQLAEDRLSASFIADGHHLPPEVLKAMMRAKGVERCVLVSDSVALAGMPAGVYTTPVGGRVELTANGRLSVHGSQILAGATASLAHGIGHVVRSAGIPLHQALAMGTVNPGRFAGGRGRMACGEPADLVRFRWTDEIRIHDVWLAGAKVYPAQDG